MICSGLRGREPALSALCAQLPQITPLGAYIGRGRTEFDSQKLREPRSARYYHSGAAPVAALYPLLHSGCRPLDTWLRSPCTGRTLQSSSSQYNLSTNAVTPWLPASMRRAALRRGHTPVTGVAATARSPRSHPNQRGHTPVTGVAATARCTFAAQPPGPQQKIVGVHWCCCRVHHAQTGPGLALPSAGMLCTWPRGACRGSSCSAGY